MAKKTSLKAALTSHQNRLEKNNKAKEAVQRNQKQAALGPSKGKSTSTGTRKQTVPFRTTDTILLIGEGNFSFSRAVLSHPALKYLPPKNVTATSYDSEQECFDKYADARQIVDELRSRGVEVLFSVDATALERCKPLKGRRWDRVVWNFPHSGKGITDQDRNILSNQMLLLAFLRSVAPFLMIGPIPSVHTPRKRKASGDDESDEEQPSGKDDDAMSEVEDMTEDAPAPVDRSRTRGTVLITLRNVPPYSEWNLPKLAKSPPRAETQLIKPYPQYIQLRSFAFRREDWPGYEHRMTKGERAHGTGTTGRGGEDRTWEFCLRDPDPA